MRLLAIDTATEACSVALLCDGQVHGRIEVTGRGHTQRVLPMIAEVLAEAGIVAADIDLFACGVGPGSFAGVRIGVGLVKGLALALDRPVVPVSSLHMLAQQALPQAQGLDVLAAIDARMGEIYLARFAAGEGGLAKLQDGPRVGPPTAVAALDRAAIGVGTGFAAAEGALPRQLGALLSRFDAAALPDARFALVPAEQAWRRGVVSSADALEPLYLRERVALTLAEQQASRQRGPRQERCR